jgi:hypothetical protein
MVIVATVGRERVLLERVPLDLFAEPQRERGDGKGVGRPSTFRVDFA